MMLALLALAGSALALTCPATQREVLVEIYDATDGANWKTNNWLSGDSICTWTGVTCEASNNYVIALDLSDMGLTGTIPENIGCLTYLKTLYLSNNSLAGAIPEGLCQLTNLQYLQVNSAGLTGDIPECMCDLIHLMFWYMSDNALTGSIPTCINELQFLKELHLDCNQLSGTVPVGLMTLPYLMELYLNCNPDLTCPDATGVQFVFKCGDVDCENCGTLPPTNCAQCFTDPDCGEYCLTPP
ncbi:Cyst wall protein 1 [Giardia duodenalis]|uniref:Cyst wall protein 1 n=3 Tax=Giardia intestinalis TaxID=5741 RepID=E2RTX3_GIAIC|nr:Cyst wall protein 1 [Giardia intestinalis]AAC46634.1 cyst wall protein 1 [Giardia intestinalis]KAE8304436.1 Cyst wall protein 1 [Giardia intestinalis]prf//2113356A acidic Leu-rich protein [Giardia intestinalis]|eukprot:XP_001704890.1 Cyst wall protein 1 [Giardia lamblia ATCC 50803]